MGAQKRCSSYNLRLSCFNKKEIFLKDSSSLILLISAIAVGISLASQAGVNSQLRVALASPIQAAFISFFIGTIILGIITLFQGGEWIEWQGAKAIPWWAWLGGLLGAFNIAVSIFLAPRLGAVALAISVVCGQLIASLLYDQYGLLGYAKMELTPSRITGALFLIWV